MAIWQTTPQWRPSTCPDCGHRQVKTMLYGMVGEPLDDSTVVLGGCVVSNDQPEWECASCGHRWSDWAWLELGESIETTGRNVNVTSTDLKWIPQIRARLIAAAEEEQTITYRDLKSDVGLPHAPSALGRLMDLVSTECGRRGEPSLAAIAVNSATGEVGADFDGDAVAERLEVFDRWSPWFSDGASDDE